MGNRNDINNDREKRHPKGSTEVAYIVDDGGDGTLDWGIDDLEKGVKKTMGDYLNCITEEAGNAFVIDAGSKEVSLRNRAGEPSSFKVGGTNRQSFATAAALKGWDSNYLDSNSGAKTSKYLSKGRPFSKQTESGHQLLPSIEPKEGLRVSGKSSVDDDGKHPASKQISQVLRTNRFNPTPDSTPFVDDQTLPTVAGRLRSTLGVFDEGENITYEDIAKIGLSLMVKATGHDNAGDKDPTAGSLTATQLLPSLLQTAVIKLESNELNAARAFPLTQFDRVTLESDVTLDYGDDEAKSYGQLNSHVEPFDGFLPLGMTVLSAALVPALLLATEGVFSLLSLIIKFDLDSVRNDPGPYTLGEWGRPEPSGILSTIIGPKQLGLFMTEHAFAEAVDAGVNVFFGFEGENILNAVGSSLLNVIQSPGYYAVVVRSILRSANTIVNEIQEAFSGGSFAESLQAVLGLVDVLKSSKVFAYFNMLAQLGDLELAALDRQIISTVGQKEIASVVDEIDDRAPDIFGVVQKARVNVMKSRIKAEDPERAGVMSLKLAWRASSSPAMYILPKPFLRAGADLGGNVNPGRGILTSDLVKKSKITRAGKRISALDVEILEDAMEAEYVPFYFHDLRTNEIVSFHAFLASLNDGFSANYESVDGFGRIDPVRIYKNTERTIDFSFHVAATSEEDFDEMWWKINKIITLLYPQWSPGNKVSNGAQTFRQPFSQIPTASPLIRLRIGDVVKSNYSKFNLSRLFGLGRKDFELPNYTPGEVNSQTFNLVDSEKERLSDGRFLEGDNLMLSVTKGKGYSPAPADPAASGLGALADALGGGAKRKVSVKVTAPTKVVVTSISTVNIGSKRKGFVPVKAITVSRAEDDGQPFFDRSGEAVVDIVVTTEDLSSFPESTNFTSILEGFVESSEDAINAVRDFFDADNNTIVRAFDSSKGRGLAGVITSMNFDWYTPTWETDTVGSKAPKFCLVNVSFAPIHDIAPGLDSNGMNRAPVYPVGRIMNNSFGDVRDDKDNATLQSDATLQQAKDVL